MKYISSTYFLSQIDILQKKYPKLSSDLEDFFEDFNPRLAIKLWKWFYKFRIKNSSIPTGKRWGYRIIIKILWDNIIPISIYSKTHRENISFDEIIDIYSEIIDELK